MHPSTGTRIALLAGLAAFALAAAVPGHAQVVFHVDLDTTPLIGHVAGPFALDFDLLDGSGMGDANNAATLSGFTFGGGNAAGLPSLMGGASGSLTEGAALVDSSFFNDFQQAFEPGSLLSFDVSLTTSVDADGTPDEFSFKILDSTGIEIPTTGFGDKLLLVDITGPAPHVETFGGDTSRTPAGGGGAIALFAPRVRFGGPPAAVPEASPSTLILVGLAALVFRLRRYPRR